MTRVTLIANIGARGLYLMFIWLLSAAIAAWLAERKGYGERVGLTFGLVLTVLGLLIVLLLPGRPGSKWRVEGWLPKRRGPVTGLGAEEMTTLGEGDTALEVATAISEGWRTLDRDGRLTIHGETLTLSMAHGKVIAAAPVSEVVAEPSRLGVGAAARITVGGSRYTLTPRFFVTYNPAQLQGLGLQTAGLVGGSGAEFMAGRALRAAADVGRVMRGRKMTQALLSAIKAAGGQVPSD